MAINTIYYYSCLNNGLELNQFTFITSGKYVDTFNVIATHIIVNEPGILLTSIPSGLAFMHVDHKSDVYNDMSGSLGDIELSSELSGLLQLWS